MATTLPTQTTVKAKLATTAAVTYKTTAVDAVSTHLYDVKTTGDYEWTVSRVEGANTTEARQNGINEHMLKFGVLPATVDSITLIK